MIEDGQMNPNSYKVFLPIRYEIMKFGLYLFNEHSEILKCFELVNFLLDIHNEDIERFVLPLFLLGEEVEVLL